MFRNIAKYAMLYRIVVACLLVNCNMQIIVIKKYVNYNRKQNTTEMQCVFNIWSGKFYFI